jgi:nicotinate-nucleotide pyrophosphorylase (carboxylating)
MSPRGNKENKAKWNESHAGFLGAADAALFTDAQNLVVLALEEDVGGGDVTSEVCIPPGTSGAASIVARQAGVLAGIWLAGLVYDTLEQGVKVEPLMDDGQMLRPGQEVARVSGPVTGILTGERVVLNFLQRLCGVATLTRSFVEAVRGTRAAICDTRKTTPGWRRLEKYAVRCGGGTNHRLGLYDEILIKDNHLALSGMGLAAVVREARARVRDRLKIEIEVDTLEQLEAVLGLPVDYILLDNMPVDMIRAAVALRDARATAGPLLEASGGVTLATVRAIAETGVERISVGALTHSAPALDLAMDVRKESGP